jgi:hypothetical protein
MEKAPLLAGPVQDSFGFLPECLPVPRWVS